MQFSRSSLTLLLLVALLAALGGWIGGASCTGDDWCIIGPSMNLDAPMTMKQVDQLNAEIQNILRDEFPEQDVIVLFAPFDGGRSGKLVCVGPGVERDGNWKSRILSHVWATFPNPIPRTCLLPHTAVTNGSEHQTD